MSLYDDNTLVDNSGGRSARSLRVHFKVGLDVVVEGRMHPIQQVVGGKFGSEFGGKGLGSMVDVGGQRPGNPPKFFVCAWFGGTSREVSVCPVDAKGMADVALSVSEGDVDTLKLSVVFNVEQEAPTPRGPRNCHLATGFMGVPALVSLLSQASAGRMEDCQQVFCMRDNYTKNIAVLKLANVATDLQALQSIPLVSSALNHLDELNQAVLRMGNKVHSHLERCSVLQCNAGPQYMTAFTYLPMQGVLNHYAMLGMTMRSVDTPVDLPLVMYNAYLAVQSTGIHPAALATMPDHDLIMYFGAAMVTQHTGCERTAPYSSDVTFSSTGQVSRETEHIRRSLSSVALLTQGVTRPFVRRPAASRASLATIIQTLGKAISDHGQPKVRPCMGGELCRDDCENQYWMNHQMAAGVKRIYPSLVAMKVPEETMAAHLCDSMCREQHTMPSLFGKLTRSHHALMAPILLRLSKCFNDGTCDLDLCVVSAKGPSFSADCPQGSDLNGHATGILRVRMGSLFFHLPSEGTTYLRMTPPGLGHAVKLQARLISGEVQQFGISEMGTVMGQNIHDVAGFTPDGRILAHIPCDLQPGQDPMLSAPFYVAAFYSGLPQGNAGSIGCVPVDTRGAYSAGQEGSRPLFGAPVMGLSLPTTMAMPVHENLFADEAEGMGSAGGDEILTKIKQLATEIWSPAASKQTMQTFMSYYEPCEPPDGLHLRKDYKDFIQCENTWAFDNPDHTAMATTLYSMLAAKFNTLQSQDPQSDGAVASAHGKYRSTSLVLSFNVPKACFGAPVKPFSLSCMRNMRRAVKELGMEALTTAQFKTQVVAARAQVPSQHYVYMCDQGGGFVHAHRVKLA